MNRLQPGEFARVGEAIENLGRLFLIVLALVVAITGCATERVRIEPVEIRVPVPVPCVVKLKDDPALPAEQEPPAADYFEAMKRALASIELLKAWAKETRAATAACQIGKGTP